MSLPGRRRLIASATAVIVAAIGFAPVQNAVADTPPPPALTAGTAHVSIYGPSAPLDITVNTPVATDAYVRLDADPNLHFTDDAGNVLPSRTDAYGRPYVTVGEDDSDHNGVPGAPIPAGVIHLHVSAVYPAVMSELFDAYVYDGATGEPTTAWARGEVFVDTSSMNGTYENGYNSYPQTGSGIPLTAGAAYPLTQDEQVDMRFAAHPDTWHLRMRFTADALAAAGFDAQQFAHALRVQHSADDGTNWASCPTAVEADGSVTATCPNRPWTAVTEWAKLRIWVAWGTPAGTLRGTLQLLGLDGRQYGADGEPLVIDNTQRPGALRAAFYGRDAAGQLWQYQGGQYTSLSRVYEPRQHVGGGWDAYDALTAVAPLKADGTGEMVARDHSGVLWLYQGSGTIKAPFAPRTRIGAGWNEYTSLTGAGDVTGDGRADLLARDAGGVLWLYRGTGVSSAPFAPRIRIGAGWNAYDLTTAGSDLTGDNLPDLLARDPSGALWLYSGTGSATAPYRPRVRIGTGWQGYTHIVSVGDLMADGHPDILATDASGALWYYAGTGNAAAPYKPRQAVGTGWGVYTAIV